MPELSPCDLNRTEKMRSILLLASLLLLNPIVAIASDKPNIVLVFLDNFGWGEPGFNVRHPARRS